MTGWWFLAVALGGWAWHAAWMRRSLRELEARSGAREAQSSGAEAHHADEVFAHFGEAVLRLDAQGRVLAANPTARRTLGLRAALPLPMLAVYRDPDWIAAFQRAIAALDTPCSLPPMRIAGRVLAPRLAPLRSGEALMLCLDVTREDRLERQRRDFLANLMHDLKTPLTSLLGYARSLESFGDDPAFRREAAKVIADEAKRVNELLQMVLELESQDVAPAEAARADAVKAVEEAARSFRERARAAGVRIEVEASDAGVPVAIDPQALMRVVNNLLENAMRHGCPDGGVVELVCRRGRDGVEIEVADGGPGIPEAHLARVTERFYRVDAARVAGGHGLGLAIVRETVEQAGGKLMLENREPHGLRAVVRLPAALD
ncbi:MAG: ATP-binding protein [Mariprofundaceae bacterium]